MTSKKIKESYTVSKAAKKIGMPVKLLRSLIEDGSIKTYTSRDKIYVCEHDVNRLLEQKNTFVGIATIMEHAEKNINSRFVTEFVSNRNKYEEFLELNDYFGCERLWPDKILFELDRKSFKYIKIADYDYLIDKSIVFFETYGFTETEKRIFYMEHDQQHPITVADFKDFLKYQNRVDLQSPSLTEMIKCLLEYPIELHEYQEFDIAVMKRKMSTNTAFDFLQKFSQHQKYTLKRKCKYNDFYDSQKEYHRTDSGGENKKNKAYSKRFVADLAVFIFNRDYIAKEKLIERALGKSFFAEMWLYIASTYIVAWRRQQICLSWEYLNLDDDTIFPEINRATLKEDIINGVYDDDLLIKIADFMNEKIKLKRHLPHKINRRHPRPLRIAMRKKKTKKLRQLIDCEKNKNGDGESIKDVPTNLKSFFGTLYLMMAYHHNNSGEGKLKTNRISRYCNRFELEKFFGREFKGLMGTENFEVNRMNKSMLQSIYQSRSLRGESGVVLSRLASSARNHTNLSSISYYLNDYNYVGEGCSFLLTQLIDMGAMSVIPYKLLCYAHPDSFAQLSTEEKKELIKLTGSPLNLELAFREFEAVETLKEVFREGEWKDTESILRTLHIISQGGGHGKEKGVYCLKRAAGYVCDLPFCDSCISINCEHHIFTKQAIPALISVINEFKEKYELTKDPRILNYVKNELLPNYKHIIESIMRDMEKKEQQDFIRWYRERILNG